MFFEKNERTKGLTFFDRYPSEAKHETFGEKHYLDAHLKLEYKPPINFSELKFSASKLASSDSFQMIPEVTKSTHATDSSFNLGKFADRTFDVQTLQFAWYAYSEELVRTRAFVNLEGAFYSRITNKIWLGLAKSDIGILAELTNYADLELRNLYNSATPIGKVTLPTELNISLQGNVLTLAENGDHIKAMSTLFEELQKKYYLKNAFLEKLRFTSKVLGISATGATGYKIATSDDKVAAAEEEVVDLSGGLAGGYLAGKLALPYCSKFFHPVAKTVCQVGATVAGSIMGTELVNDLYQKVIKKNEDSFDKSLSNASDLDLPKLSEGMELSGNRYIETSPALNEFFHEFEADGKLNLSK